MLLSTPPAPTAPNALSALRVRLRGGDGEDEAKKPFSLDAFKVKAHSCADTRTRGQRGEEGV